jgi:monomeric sarcosine oxidase
MSEKWGEDREPRKRARPRSLSRRTLLGALAAAAAGRLSARQAAATAAVPGTAGARPAKSSRRGPRIVVVGAGAFGGWTALWLLRRGANVTLVDAWGPGNSRASSGGETRVIRGVYGSDRIYTEMAARAFRLWREAEARWGKKLYRRTGALWMVADEGEFVRASMPILRESGFAYEELTTAQAARRYPQIDLEGIRWALFEKEAGYLSARRSCADVVEGFLTEGGQYRETSAAPGEIAGGAMKGLKVSDGSTLTADVYVFACGPWLSKLFPDLLGSLVQPTRQEVFYFGTPAGDDRFSEARFPVWVEVPRFFYGIPGNERRGFKIADDARGEPFDPTDGDRRPSDAAIEAARAYLARRFPALKNAPLLESRVCQYENTPDHHFLLDRHPEANNIWIVGGGSGHGFKHGPALGEMAADNVLGRTALQPLFSFARFDKARRS